MAAFNSANDGRFGGAAGRNNWNGPFNATPNRFGINRNLRINNDNGPAWNPNSNSNFNFNFNNSNNPTLSNFNSAANAFYSNFNNLMNAMNAMNAINREQQMNMANAFNQINNLTNRNEMDRIVMEMNMNTQRALNAINNINNSLANNALCFDPNFIGAPNCQWKRSFSNNVEYTVNNVGSCCVDECCNNNCNSCWNCDSCWNCPGPVNGGFSVSQSGFSSGNPAQNWSRTTYTVRLPNGQVYQRTINN